jgi:hypothetical protein
MAWSQTSYGVPVEPPTEVPVEPHLRPVTTPSEGPIAPRGSSGGSYAHITPSITISERYDSNVLFQQDKVHDYVTNISPGVLFEYKDDMIDSSFRVGVSSELYARNPGLNYVGTNATIYGNLDNIAGKFIRGWTLRLTDSIVYTPQMPAFAAPQGGNIVAADFVRGIQAYRNNMLTNSVSVQSAYELARNLSLSVLYSHSIIRFLDDSNVDATRLLFNSTSQSLTAGPVYQLSPNDTVSLSYLYQHMAFIPQGGGAATTPLISSTTSLQGGIATWRRNLSRTLIAEISPGLSIIEGSRDPAWTARAQVLWNALPTTLTISYSRGLYPSVFISSGVFLSDVVAASFTHALTSKWSTSGQYSYSVNRLIADASGRDTGAGGLDSTGHSTGVSLIYRISSSMSAIGSVNHTEFSYEFQGARTTVARDLVTLQLRAEWK